MKRIKWLCLAVIWIIMRMMFIPLDIILYILDLSNEIFSTTFVLYAKIYNRLLALYGCVVIDLRMIEENLDSNKTFVSVATRDKQKLIRIAKEGEE